MFRCLNAFADSYPSVCELSCGTLQHSLLTSPQLLVPWGTNLTPVEGPLVSTRKDPSGANPDAVVCLLAPDWMCPSMPLLPALRGSCQCLELNLVLTLVVDLRCSLGTVVGARIASQLMCGVRGPPTVKAAKFSD